MSDASILTGGEICPVGTPDLSHDRATRVRPVGTVDLLPRGRGIAQDTRGTPSFNRPYGTTSAGIVVGLKSRRPYGTFTRVHFNDAMNFSLRPSVLATWCEPVLSGEPAFSS